MEISLDGGAYAAYQAPISLADGAHTLAFRAYDIAGNLTEMTQNVNVDSLTPELTLSLNGALGLDKLDPAGGTFESAIAWDGRWADGSLAIPGE